MRKASEIKNIEMLFAASTLTLKVNELFSTLREIDLINENALKDVDLNLVEKGPINSNGLVHLNNSSMFLGIEEDVIKGPSLSFATFANKEKSKDKYIYLRLSSIQSYISYDEYLAEKLYIEINEVEEAYKMYMETFNRLRMLDCHVKSFNSAIARNNINLTEVTSVQKEELVTTERKDDSNYDDCFNIE